MKRSDFFKKLFIGATAMVVAPTALLGKKDEISIDEIKRKTDAEKIKEYDKIESWEEFKRKFTTTDLPYIIKTLPSNAIETHSVTQLGYGYGREITLSAKKACCCFIDDKYVNQYGFPTAGTNITLNRASEYFFPKEPWFCTYEKPKIKYKS